MDPYYFFQQWMRANGYADVCDASPERVDLARINEAVAAYGRQSTAAEAHQRRAEQRYELPANRLR